MHQLTGSSGSNVQVALALIAILLEFRHAISWAMPPNLLRLLKPALSYRLEDCFTYVYVRYVQYYLKMTRNATIRVMTRANQPRDKEAGVLY